MRAVFLVEPCEQQIVGEIVPCLACHHRVGAVTGAQSVGHGDRHGRGGDGQGVECHILRAVPVPVAVAVVDGIHAVVARFQTSDRELAILVGLGDTFQRQGGDGRVGEIAVDAYQHTLRRLEVAGLEHHARYHKGVERVAG